MKFVQDKMTKLWTYIDYTSGSDSSVIADRQILLFFFLLIIFFLSVLYCNDVQSSISYRINDEVLKLFLQKKLTDSFLLDFVFINTNVPRYCCYYLKPMK